MSFDYPREFDFLAYLAHALFGGMVMATELVETSFDGLLREHGSPVGLVLQPSLTLDEFGDRCVGLGKVRSFSPFALGDLWNYGVREYGEKKAAQKILLTGYTVQLARKYGEVGAAIPYEYRNHALPFEHHLAVYKLKSPGCSNHQGSPVADCHACMVTARLDEIVAWLDKAEKKKWTASQLKDAIRDATATKVREHNRRLPGQEFDPEPIKNAVSILKHWCSRTREHCSGLITAKSALDKKKAKALLERIDELEKASAEARTAIEAEL